MRADDYVLQFFFALLCVAGCGDEANTRRCVTNDQCHAGEICLDGACIDEIDSGTSCPVATPTSCGPGCVNTQTDPEFCGSCEISCNPGDGCQDGVCVTTTCDERTVRCDSSCIDTMTDPLHCGGCGMACSGGGRCAGTCVPPASCRDAHERDLDLPDGVYTIDPDGPTGVIEPFRALCDMTTDGGGWTLVLTRANDGVNTFTWNARTILWDDTVVGSVDAPTVDYKSRAYWTVPFIDMYFVGSDGIDAGYNGVEGATGTQTVAEFMRDMGYETSGCMGDREHPGSPLSFGSLMASTTEGTFRLRDDALYFSMHDQEGGVCPRELGGCNHNTVGPTWSVRFNNSGDGVHFDDPIYSTVAAVSANLCKEWSSHVLEYPGRLYSGDIAKLLGGTHPETQPEQFPTYHQQWFIR